MSNLVEHARTELKSWFDGGMNEAMANDVIELIDVFSKQGHSGFSANFAIGMFEKLAKFEPWGPLTGEDDEWTEVSEGVFQNKRCSHVFKENGKAYDIDGKVFREPNGSCYTSRDSRVPVTFPYTPKREYVDVTE